ncbi:molybdopterin biosynthesis protein [Anaeromicrobium sediminis]|uniref:Molybdopterin molybdenumtransferase n=1 Tax=Anaeromicrobium sediminis TaxID=1478221 RepID=A0A267MJW3_9FIRM|nr:molybdopterin biosynthesis protein [Anaeromicrobium sediminis]PAB59874.1 molybdopterin biosynthesis protein [Anaeromicrobium sediminis]
MKKFDRNIYLSNMELHEAKKLFFDEIDKINKYVSTETIPTIDSMGRITTRAVFANSSSPHYNASAMDGICVKASSTYGADERNPVKLLLNEDFIYVDTGDPIMPPYDAVIMIEDVMEIDNNNVKIMKPAYPWQHIRPVGEDMVAGEMIIPSFKRIHPVDIGAMLCGQVLEVEVSKRPMVGLIPTGTEIVEPHDELSPGKIIESNSRVFENLVKEYGGISNRYPPVIDNMNLIEKAILRACDENDIVIINAGSSAGTEDYTSTIIKNIGKLLVHGIAIKPGKPTILGIVNDTPVIGIPGYPVSAFLSFEEFVKPLVHKFLSLKDKKKKLLKATLSKKIVSSLKHKEFVRMKIGKVEDKFIATPLNRGAGVTMSLVRADGILKIPQELEGIQGGKTVEVELLKDKNEIENTIVSIGSHDLILDILSNIISKTHNNIFLSSAHVGSLGGIMSMKRGEAHMAPIHLLDELTGTYNESYIKKYLKNKDMVLIKGIKRQQGFILQKNNPKNIKVFEDLLNKDLVFVNRQKGSGTRVLLDYNLKKLGLDSSLIRGYEREMTTHMNVASCVLSGSAHVGVGVKSVANTMNLDFIPIGLEDYDFLVPKKFIDTHMINNFISILKSQEFKDELENLGGYEMEDIQIVEV